MCAGDEAACAATAALRSSLAAMGVKVAAGELEEGGGERTGGETIGGGSGAGDLVDRTSGDAVNAPNSSSSSIATFFSNCTAATGEEDEGTATDPAGTGAVSGAGEARPNDSPKPSALPATWPTALGAGEDEIGALNAPN